MKAKFDILPEDSISLRVRFVGYEETESSYFEVDMDAWEELVPNIATIRLVLIPKETLIDDSKLD